MLDIVLNLKSGQLLDINNLKTSVRSVIEGVQSDEEFDQNFAKLRQELLETSLKEIKK
jgi:hypothetical protein